MMEFDLKSENIDTLIQEVSKGVSALTEGTLIRWNEKRDLIHAMNMCKIVEKARAKMDQEHSTPLGVNSGWLLDFLDKSKTVSDDEMQNIWANILANEANNPGGCSIRTLNALKSIDKKEAEYFTKLCHFIVTIEKEDSYFDFVPMILHQTNDEIYSQHGINLSILNQIQNDLGLIKLNNQVLNSFHSYKILAEPIESLSITYHGKKLKLKVPKGEYRYRDGKARVNLGIAKLTKVGFELCQICETKPINGFFEYVQTKLQDDINQTLKTE